MSTPESRLLVDLLPPGEYYDDRRDEALLIEDLRRGRLSVAMSVAAEGYEPLLRMMLKKGPDDPLSYADWAMLRYYLQYRCQDYLLGLAMDDFHPEVGSRPLVTDEHGAAVAMKDLYDRALAEDDEAATAQLLAEAEQQHAPPREES